MTRDLAQLILYNANVVTMDRQRPQAGLVAIRDERILAVSGNDELDEMLQNRVRDRQG